MRRLLFAFVLSSLFLTSKGQLILPEFTPPQKIEVLGSVNEENTPLVFNNGKGIYYNTVYVQGFEHKTRVVGHDIWVAKKTHENWHKPYRLFTEKDLKGENLIVGTTGDGSRVYLLNSIVEKDSLIRRLIYLDHVKKHEWSDPVEVNIPGLQFGKDAINFYVNPNETVILVSKPPEGRENDEDVFVSLKQENGFWGELIHLGNKINTNRYEIASFISEDLKALYFSSEGHGGYGASDIFVSYRLDDTWKQWTNPLNMGPGINSDAYDAFLTMGTPTEVYFTSNRNSNHSNLYKSTTTGKVYFANSDSVLAAFFYKGLPGEGVNIRIENEDGELIETALTDEEGKFKFAKLEGDETPVMKIEGDDPELYFGSTVYFLDANNERTQRFIFTSDGLFVNAATLAEGTKVQGIFSYEGLPAIRAALVVYDQNGYSLDTIYTDETGGFTYEFLNYDGGFTMAPMNMTEDDFVNVDISILNQIGEPIKVIEAGKFKSMGDLIVKQEIKTPKVDQEAPIDRIYNKDMQQEVDAWNGMADESKRVYFDFKQKKASTKELSKLSLVVSILKMAPSLQVQLIGHTDDKGSEKINHIFGLARANQIKRHMLSKGVSEEQINILSKGETQPVADNSTDEGRALNRRVEIKIE